VKPVSAAAAVLLLATAPGGAGCGSSPVAAPIVADRAPVAAASAPPASNGDAAPPISPHDARVAAALERVPTIAQTVAEIRHLPLKHPVPADVQSQEAFRAFLDAEVKKELPPEKSTQSVRALVRLGLLTRPIDLGKTVEDAMISQAGAYYDPEAKTFHLVLVPEDESMLDVMSAHELTHALDDQYFDLGAYAEDPKHELSNDAQQARRFVGEGEATLVMLAYQARVAAHQDIFDAKNRRMAQVMVSTFAQLDSEQLARSAAENPALLSQMGAGMRESIEAMKSIPPFILDPLFGAYTKGAAAVAAVRDAGGWEAVSRLYTDPPESTEQLLHPAEKLIGKREHPVELRFPPAPPLLLGRQPPIDTDVVGELTMAVYLKNWGDKAAASEVVGWGGDRYAAFDVDGQVVATWLTVWDTQADATRFARAYEGTLPRRFPGARPATLPGAVGVRHADGTVTVLARSGKDVAIVEGAPPASAARLLDWARASRRTQAK